MDLKGKVAVITGGATRLGKSLTLGLAGEGCNVFIHYGKSDTEAGKTRDQAEIIGVKTSIFSADLSNEIETGSIIPAAVEAFGRIDILVNNAAVFPEHDTFKQVDADTWHYVFAVNLRAVFKLCQDFSKHIPENQSGCIVNINDARILRPDSNHITYRLAKRGLWDLTKILAMELAPRIRVNSIAPGTILAPAGKKSDYLKEIANSRIPLRQHGNPKNFVDNVIHLLQQEFLTGVTINIDGGQYL